MLPLWLKTVPREIESLSVRVLRTSGLVQPQRSPFEGRDLGTCLGLLACPCYLCMDE